MWPAIERSLFPHAIYSDIIFHRKYYRISTSCQQQADSTQQLCIVLCSVQTKEWPAQGSKVVEGSSPVLASIFDQVHLLKSKTCICFHLIRKKSTHNLVNVKGRSQKAYLFITQDIGIQLLPKVMVLMKPHKINGYFSQNLYLHATNIFNICLHEYH